MSKQSFTVNSFLIVPLVGEAALAGPTPDQGAIEAVSEALDLIGYCAFALETQVLLLAAGCTGRG